MLNVNEEAEILSRLGVLTSDLKSPFTSPLNAAEAAASGLFHQDHPTDGYFTLTDEEDSESNVIYVKRRLLWNEKRRLARRRKNSGMVYRTVVLAASFISLGISTSVQSNTLPNVAVNANANSFSFIINVLCITATGFFIGCTGMSQIFTRMNPMLLLLFSVTGNVVFTFLFGWSVTQLTVYLYSFGLGCFHGTIFRGGLIILHGSGFGSRTLFATHAFFAIGAALSSLVSAPFLSGAAVPYSRFDKLSDNRNLLHYLLTKREIGSFLSVQADDNIYMNSSHQDDAITTLKPLRPDHVVGVESIAEPKTMENVRKRNEVKKYLEKMGEEKNTMVNDSLYSGRLDDNEVSGNRDSLRNMSAALLLTTTVTVDLYVRKGGSEIESTVTLEKTNIASNTTSVSQLTTGWLVAATATSNFTTFYDMSYLFSELNWKYVSTSPFITISLWKELEQRFGPLENVHVVYLLSTFLGLCCLIPYFVAAACYSSSCNTIPNLQVAKLRATPEMFSAAGEKMISWRVYSGIFLLLTGGTEIVVGESLTLYTLCRPELNLSQRNGVLLTSTFWFGIFAARIPLILVKKLVNVSQLSNTVLLSAVVAGYIALNTPSLWAFHCALFILGLTIGPLSPSLLCWLDEQELKDRLSLSFFYCCSISIGRLIFPLLISLVIYKYSEPTAFFVVACVALSVTYVALVMTSRTVRVAARLSAINHFSKSVEEGCNEMRVEQKKARKGDYVTLVDESDTRKCQNFSLEEDDDFDRDFLVGE